MNSPGPKSSKPRTPTSQWQGSPRFSSAAANSSSYSPISSHMAMVELKQNILASISKLADRDTYEIAVSDLEFTIQTISQDAIPMLLNCLFDSSNHHKTSVKKESIRLLAWVCTNRGDSMLNHLTKIITHLSRRLTDSDSGVRYACRDAIGALSSQYLNNESVVDLFAKPLFEAMSDPSKTVQGGAALCMTEMVDSAAEPPIAAFQKLCVKVCKLLNNPNFLGKAALLTVVSSLSQVGAIAPQSFHSLLQGIQECLRSPDWATRKAAAEALTALALHSTKLITDRDASTLTVLEGCRFDKVKPVRDSMLEALQLWKKIFGTVDEGPDDLKSSSQKNENQELVISGEIDMDPGDSLSKAKEVTVMDKAVLILKKKAPALTDKELNPDFFQKHETWDSGDLPIEVVVPHGYHNSSNSNEHTSAGDCIQRSYHFRQPSKDKKWSLRVFDDECFEDEEMELITSHAVKSNSDSGILVTIQRQLVQLERQQTQLMNMLQDFMGGSHSKMTALENRVRGVERVVEDMVRDLSISPGRRSSSFVVGLQGSTDRSVGKYNDYDSNGSVPSMRGRYMKRGSDTSPTYSISNNNNGKTGLRNTLGRPQNGEGPSSRNVWKASKDEATLEAIREAGEDHHGRAAQVSFEDMEACNVEQEGDPVWHSWSNAMDALEVGDTDAAYAEVLSTGDDVLLVRLMERSGPAVDQLSSEVAAEVLHAVAQLMVDQNLLETCLCWIRQFVDLLPLEKGGFFGVSIPDEVKNELVMNLHGMSLASSMVPNHLLFKLASAWHINLPETNECCKK